MQNVSKKLDEKIETINRIKNPKKTRYEHQNHTDYIHIFELPTITNTSTKFNKKEEKQHPKYNSIFSSQSRGKVQQQLDAIVNSTLRSNQKINKVIFASPLSSRVNFGKTHFKRSRFASVDGELSYEQIDKKSNSKIKIKQKLNLSSLKVMKQSKEIFDFNYQMSPKDKLNYKKAIERQRNLLQSDFGMFYTTPQEINLPVRKQKNRKKIIRNSVKKQIPQRYSPWKSQESDDLFL